MYVIHKGFSVFRAVSPASILGELDRVEGNNPLRNQKLNVVHLKTRWSGFKIRINTMIFSLLINN